MEKLILGFSSGEVPVLLTENTSPNDACASYFFRQDGAYYLLWVEHQNRACRESASSPRYAISCAINEGDDNAPEIYNDASNDDIFQSDKVEDLIAYLG